MIPRRPRPIRYAALLALVSTTAILRPPTAQAQEVRPLHVGQQAPALTLPTLQGDPFDLAEAAAEGPVVVVFQRGWVGYW